jgi:hypothetical protein
MKQVVVNWVDARSDDGWTEASEINMQTANITTLGHLVQETEYVLCIASSRDARTGQLSGIMYIPKVCILSRRTITETTR